MLTHYSYSAELMLAESLPDDSVQLKEAIEPQESDSTEEKDLDEKSETSEDEEEKLMNFYFKPVLFVFTCCVGYYIYYIRHLEESNFREKIARTSAPVSKFREEAIKEGFLNVDTNLLSVIDLREDKEVKIQFPCEGYANEHYLNSPVYQKVLKHFPSQMEFCILDNKSFFGYISEPSNHNQKKFGYVFFPIMFVKSELGYNVVGLPFEINSLLDNVKFDHAPCEWTLKPKISDEDLSYGEILEKCDREIVDPTEFGSLDVVFDNTPDGAFKSEFKTFWEPFSLLKKEDDENSNELILSRISVLFRAAAVARGIVIGTSSYLVSDSITVSSYLGISSIPNVEEGLLKAQGVLEVMFHKFKNAEFLNLFGKPMTVTGFKESVEKKHPDNRVTQCTIKGKS